MLGFTLATVSVNQTPLDWNGNARRITEALVSLSVPEAGGPGVPELILFPELTISGYNCEDAFHSTDVTKRSLNSLLTIAETARKILPETVVILGLPLRYNDLIYNCMAVVYQGRIIGLAPKSNLAGDGVHYEPRWFTAWKDKPGDEPARVLIDSGEYSSALNKTPEFTAYEAPLGSFLFEFKGARFILEICEDSWVPARPAMNFLRSGVDFILNPAASHFAFGKQNTRRNIALETSRNFITAYVSVNLLGCESGRTIYDGGGIIASQGKLLFEGERFSFREFQTDRFAFDLDVNRVLRGRVFSYKEQNHVDTAHFNETRLLRFGPSRALIPEENEVYLSAVRDYFPVISSKHEEFLRAECLGLFDYLRKSHSRGFVVSLSGGADSATCAILVQRMLLYACRELGPAPALVRLGRLQPGEDFNTFLGNENLTLESQVDRITRGLLHTIYQATSQSSDVTRNAAKEVAKALNAGHHEVNIQEMVDSYKDRMEGVLARELTWQSDDLALQNIQARVRAPMAWFLANTTGSLLLTTSNRSEGAVGYCTMDGDTSGGLAPIAGVDKAYIRQWLIFMEQTGDELGGPIPELKFINEQAPTAELRPGEQKQTDESDLMPYELLDRIELLAIRDRKAPADILKILSAASEEELNYSLDELRTYIKKFFTLWSRNQWKRERYAPSFHLDDENLDPRSWYRFPILSGGYASELDDL